MFWLLLFSMSVGPLAILGTAATSSPGGLNSCGTGATPISAAPVASSRAQSASSTQVAELSTSKTDIALPGAATRFDYQVLDTGTGRLYLAHMGDGQIVVFDIATQQVTGTIDNLPQVTGLALIPGTSQLYASVSATHQIAAIDTRTNSIVAQFGDIGFPDGIDFAPQADRLFVSDESGGGEVVIDLKTNRVVDTIDIGGEAGNTHFDPGSGCILVAVQSKDQLVAIDPSNDKIARAFDLDQACKGPHGFTLDAPDRRAFVSCEDNATLLDIDLTSMTTMAVFSVGDKPDVLAFDSGWKRLYVASESGTVSVFDEQQDQLSPIGEYRAAHAHTVSVDSATHLVYLPLENVDGKPVLRIVSFPPPATAN
jgi:DNA-binding beta-propeller fold protein YncE